MAEKTKATEKIKDLIEKYLIQEGVIKPNRPVFLFKSDEIREIFNELINKLGPDGFYISTIVGTDLPKENKIRLDYYLVILPEEETIVFRTFLSRDEPVIDSIVDICHGALGGECEVYDLLGVVFKGNEALRRGFFVPSDLVEKGVYPLRKDSGV